MPKIASQSWKPPHALGPEKCYLKINNVQSSIISNPSPTVSVNFYSLVYVWFNRHM